MFRTISYAVEFMLGERHLFAMKRIGGFWVDTLEIYLDGERVLSTPVNVLSIYIYVNRRHFLDIDGQRVQLVWRWSIWSGDPKFVVLATESKMLATYGSPKAIARLRFNPSPDTQREGVFAALRISREEVHKIEVRIIARDQFPLDNREGSDAFSVENEVTRTLTSSMKIENAVKLTPKVSAKVISLIEAEISADLSRRVEESLGSTITKRQKVSFSVQAGAFVIYEVIWKTTSRSGTYTVTIDNQPVLLDYTSEFGLSFEISSHRGAGVGTAADPSASDSVAGSV